MIVENSESPLEYSPAGVNETYKGEAVLGTFTGPNFFPNGFSRNDRFYPEELWDKVLANPDTQRKLKDNHIFGTLGHDTVLTEKEILDGYATHIVTSLEKRATPEGTNIGYGELKVLSTDGGQTIDKLAKAGVKFYSSTRGGGELKQGETMQNPKTGNSSPIVDPDQYNFGRIDLVFDPGFIEAEQVYESSELGTVQSNVSQMVESLGDGPRQFYESYARPAVNKVLHIAEDSSEGTSSTEESSDSDTSREESSTKSEQAPEVPDKTNKDSQSSEDLEDTPTPTESADKSKESKKDSKDKKVDKKDKKDPKDTSRYDDSIDLSMLSNNEDKNGGTQMPWEKMYNELKVRFDKTESEFDSAKAASQKLQSEFEGLKEVAKSKSDELDNLYSDNSKLQEAHDGLEKNLKEWTELGEQDSIKSILGHVGSDSSLVETRLNSTLGAIREYKKYRGLGSVESIKGDQGTLAEFVDILVMIQRLLKLLLLGTLTRLGSVTLVPLLLKVTYLKKGLENFLTKDSHLLKLLPS